MASLWVEGPYRMLNSLFVICKSRLGILHDRHRDWRWILRIDARVSDVAESVSRDVEESKLSFHIPRHACRETCKFIACILLKSGPPPPAHFLNLGIGVTR